VIDAYRVDAIPVSERGLAAAVQSFGYRTAAMLAGAVLVLIAAHLGWRLAFLMVACLMAATTLGTLWAPEPEVPGQPPRTLADAVWHPLRALFSQKGAWGFVLLVLLYKVGDAFALSLYSAFMIKGVGFSLDELSIAGKVNMTVSSMIGVAFGGWVYMRWGTFKSLLIFGIGQALTNLLYVWLALAGKKVWLLVLATSLDTGIGGMGLAAFVAFLVSLCSANFSATQYALLSALASVPSKVMGYVAGIVVSKIGWANFFVVTCLTAVPGLILLVILRVPLNELAAREWRSVSDHGRPQRPACSRTAVISAPHRAIVRSGPQAARVVLELAIQIFGLDVHGARPVLRRIGPSMSSSSSCSFQESNSISVTVPSKYWISMVWSWSSIATTSKSSLVPPDTIAQRSA
jgi:predicted MFS family arabinose efflux permease